MTTLHMGVVALSVVLTLVAWQFSKLQIETRTQQRFDVAAENTAKLISDRLARYEDALWAGVAALEAHGGDMSHLEWAEFATSLQIEQRHPGANGLGIIHFHLPETFGHYLEEQRLTRPDFAVKPPHDFPFYMPITVIIPHDINAAAVGLDVAHERNRRTSAFASRDTGTAQITGPIALVQDAKSTPGFLFYAPFYGPGPTDTVEARRAAFKGAVYAPVIVEKLMIGLLSNSLRQISFSLSDGDTLIYDEHSMDNVAQDMDPMHSTKIPLSVYGRTWILDIRSDMSFREANTYSQPTFILIACLIVEVLIIALLVLMSKANQRAVSYANEVTKELRTRSEELAKTVETLNHKNEELEQFSYIASHDLKTPIRGISGLVEIIEEDLEGYMQSEAGNTDVAQHLHQIKERVGRMTKLTDGILEFSRLTNRQPDAPPLLLKDMVSALVFDFELEPDQITLTGDADTVDCDPLNFRRVMENLVGNAIKYHDGKRRFAVEIAVWQKAEVFDVTVADNGPGIDPAFHEKVFEVFQTLRLNKAPESTGIGLAIVKKAVKSHGGTIALSSSDGGGARFDFQWPGAARCTSTSQTSQKAA